MLRFIPMEDADPGMETSIKEAEELCGILRKTLHYVYLFNSPGTDLLTTRCSNCGEWLMRRDFYGPMGSRIIPSQNRVDGNNSCVTCGTPVPFKTDKKVEQQEDFREANFQGGYPFTRALEILGIHGDYHGD